MEQNTTEVTVFKPTSELVQILGEPALVGQEKLQVYNAFFMAIESSIKPTDAVGALLTKDVADLSWDIRRERAIKANIIEYFRKEIVADQIKSLAPPGQLNRVLYRTFQAADDLALWETDPEARARIDTALAAQGHTVSAILAQAYMRGGSQIDAIDRRIAGYERRRDSALRSAGYWNDRLAAKLDEVTAVLDAEFTETRPED